MLWWIGLGGCAEQTVVTLTGVVWEGPGPTAPPLGEVDLEVVDEDGRRIAETHVGPDGDFTLTVEQVGQVFVAVRKDGYATTTFPGVIGTAPEQPVEDHGLYGVTLAAAEAEAARFAGCPAGGGGASVGGEIRVFGLADPVTGEAPLVLTGKALLEAPREDLPGCYLVADGSAYDPDAFWTGDAGTFGFFGLDPGIYALEVRFELTEELYETASYPVWIPEDPVVRSPWYPAWVDFPM